MAACAAICEAVRFAILEWSASVAVGREGSKKPCECCRLCLSAPVASGDFFRNGRSLDVCDIEGREKFWSDVVLALALGPALTGGRGT